jgi:two-component system NtrC family response regulator
MIGECRGMKKVYRLVRRVAPTDLPVLISGETGTGKELVARAVHALSLRARGPFIDINCAAIPENLVESELFGSERGAFTGSARRVPGLLEVADGGTLFLDEARSLSSSIQAKLLRALERHELRRVGSRTPTPSDFRLVVALSKPIAELVASGEFRPDFAFRVAGVEVALPLLRERGEDVRRLAEHLLSTLGQAEGRTLRWHEDALAELERHAWPGNVRELEMLVRRAAVLVDHHIIGVGDLRQLAFRRWVGCQTRLAIPKQAPRSKPSKDELVAALGLCGGVVSRAAKSLGMSRGAFYRAIQPYGATGSVMEGHQGTRSTR